MFPVGSRPFHALVVGEESVGASLSGWGDEPGRSLTAEVVDSGDVTDDGVADTGVDCLLVDSGLPEIDGTTVVERWTDDRPDAPVVVLVDGRDDEQVANVLSAGVAETLPRGLVDTDPDLLAERVVSAVEREYARTSVRELYDDVAGMVAVHDPDSGETLHANRRFCDNLGYDREELTSMQVGDFTADVPGYDHERMTNVVSSAAERDDPIEIEWPLTTAGGATRWTEATLRPVRIGGREVVLSTSVDVTERRRQERKYEQVFDNVNDVISIHDPWAEEMVDVNETMAELTGYSRETLLEMDLGGFSVSDEGFTEERGYEIQRRVAATGETTTVEWMVETAAGERRLLEANLAPATVAGEDRVLSLARDVTERTRREREYEQIFDMAGDGIVIHDPESGDVVDANRQVADLLGYDREAFLDRPLSEFQAEDEGVTGRQAREMIRESAEEGGQEFEWPLETADGETVWVRARHEMGEIDGERRIVALLHDITERKRREREYEQIFDGVNDSIVVQDPETAQPLDANETFLDRLGYDSVGEIREAGFEGLSATETGYTTDRARELCQHVVETGEPETVEWQQETKTGDRRWIEATVDSAVIGGEDRILSMQRDITERKRREQTLRALDDATDKLQDAETPREVCEAAIDAATAALDLQSPTCWLRESDESGVLTPVAAGDGDGDLPPGDGPGALAPDDLAYSVYESGERGSYDPSDLDGWTPPGDAVLVPLGEHGLFGAVERPDDEFDDVTLDAAGILARHVTSALDRVERARELRESERRFRLIAEHIDEIVYLATDDFSEILYINDAYEDIYGQPVEALSEDPTRFVEAAHPDDRAAYENDVEQLIADVESGDPRDAYEGQYRIEREGETRWITATRFPVENEDGTVDRIVGRVQDITERKRREREYEQIFDGVNDSITVHDPETGALLDVNETFCDLLGYDREEILEMGVEGYSPTDQGYTLEQAREFVREVVDAGQPRQTEWVVETSDGETRWLEVEGSIVEIGGELRYVSINRDVTERRRSERRLSAILDRIDEAIFMTRAGEITTASQNPDYVSSGYEEIWGQSLGTIRETYEDGFFGTLHPDDAGEYRAFVEGVVDDVHDGTAAESYSHEYRIERPDGEVRWVQSDYYPTAWESGPPRIVIVSRDVTERKARERRIASFDDATDDLATADTPAEATRSAVEAATDTLKLPAVGAFLYDGDDGVLRPEVLTGPLPAEIADDPIGPGEGPLWEGFATGTVVAPDGGHSETGFVGEREDPQTPDVLADLAAWRALALGNHGVLLVGSPDRSFGSETIQAAHVLAATLEAALNHLEGQQRLEAREEQLRTQTRRAERLDRIARLTQQVEAAITDASNPGEVERAVCERLANAGPYEFAWIGGIDVGSDQLDARVVVGASDRYVDSLDLSTADDTADPHPAVAAWRTDEVRVADSLVSDGPADEWRRHGLSAGYQSLCGVPLTYDGITHGVLTVGSDSPNAFGERERDVLSQLGTSIGNALAAIERRRALESDETVELEFRGSGESLPFARAASAADCRVRHERTAARQDGPVSVYFTFEDEVPDDASDIASRTLRGSVDVVAEEESSTLVETRTDDWFGAPIAEYGGVLREASADPDETTILVEVPSQADVRSFVERLREVAPSLELVARRQHRRQDRTPAELGDRVRAELTDRQFEVVRTALSAGYFEWPREHDGSEVAARLDITQPTFNKHLRLAERKTFGLLFSGDD